MFCFPITYILAAKVPLFIAKCIAVGTFMQRFSNAVSICYISFMHNPYLKAQQAIMLSICSFGNKYRLFQTILIALWDQQFISQQAKSHVRRTLRMLYIIRYIWKVFKFRELGTWTHLYDCAKRQTLASTATNVIFLRYF